MQPHGNHTLNFKYDNLITLTAVPIVVRINGKQRCQVYYFFNSENMCLFLLSGFIVRDHDQWIEIASIYLLQESRFCIIISASMFKSNCNSFKIQVTFQVLMINCSALLLNETVRHIYKQLQTLELTFLKNRKER